MDAASELALHDVLGIRGLEWLSAKANPDA